MPTIDQKKRGTCTRFYVLFEFKTKPTDFLRRFITVEEPWVNLNMLESQQQAKEWTEVG